MISPHAHRTTTPQLDGRTHPPKAAPLQLHTAVYSDPQPGSRKQVRVLGTTATTCNASDTNKLLMARLAELCALPTHTVHLDVVINIHSQGVCQLAPSLPPCVLKTVSYPGSKLLFWRSFLSPEFTRPYDAIWNFDNDLRLEPSAFPFHFAVTAFLESRASLSQPCVSSGGKRKNRGHIPTLRCSGQLHRCKTFPSASPCYLRNIKFVEMQAPLFTREAWTLQYEQLLSKIPLEVLRDAHLGRDAGPDHAYCSLFAKAFPGRQACAVLCMPLIHLNMKTNSEGPANKIIWGNLTRAAKKLLPTMYNKYAPGIQAGTCTLERNRSTMALRSLEVISGAAIGKPRGLQR